MIGSLKALLGCCLFIQALMISWMDPVSRIREQVEIYGQDVEGQILGVLEKAKQELGSAGCAAVSVAMWMSGAHLLEIEVTCVGWRWINPLDPWAIR